MPIHLSEQNALAYDLGSSITRPDFTHQQAIGRIGSTLAQLQTIGDVTDWDLLERQYQDDLSLNNPHDAFFGRAFRVSAFGLIVRAPAFEERKVEIGTVVVLRSLMTGASEHSAPKGVMVGIIRDVLDGGIATLKDKTDEEGIAVTEYLQGVMELGAFDDGRTTLARLGRFVRARRQK